jgi:sigma-B regulation protein RsbU (phosphoserine phosphatase)
MILTFVVVFPISKILYKAAVELLKKGGPSIGMGDLNFIDDRKIEFEEGRLTIKPGDKLFIYTDGIVEYQNYNEEF